MMRSVSVSLALCGLHIQNSISRAILVFPGLHPAPAAAPGHCTCPQGAWREESDQNLTSLLLEVFHPAPIAAAGGEFIGKIREHCAGAFRAGSGSFIEKIDTCRGIAVEA